MKVGKAAREKTRIAIIASGRGSNAKAIIDFSHKTPCNYEVGLIMSNKKTAGVLNLAKTYRIHSKHFDKKEFSSERIVEYLFDKEIDLIVLAGFLWLVPAHLIKAFPHRILNIHPSLLPKYGGKGMYGHHVHNAVKESGDKESGMTIHLVNEVYDEGRIILQAHCQLKQGETADQIGKRVLRLEHHFYPEVINGVAGKI